MGFYFQAMEVIMAGGNKWNHTAIKWPKVPRMTKVGIWSPITIRGRGKAKWLPHALVPSRWAVLQRAPAELPKPSAAPTFSWGCRRFLPAVGMAVGGADS